MKLGFVSAILADYTFEEVIDFASEHGFSCVELACWPKGNVSRRYAGVTHIDVDKLEAQNINAVREYCREKSAGGEQGRSKDRRRPSGKGDRGFGQTGHFNGYDLYWTKSFQVPV